MNYLTEQASIATTVAIIRMKMIAELKRKGVAVSKVDSMTLRTESGFTMTLHNLVQRCLSADRRHWDDMIGFHVEASVQSERHSDPEFILGMPDDEFYMRLRERVVPPSILTQVDEYDYARPLVDAPNAPMRVLNLSFPNLALTVADRYLANRDTDAAWSFGRDNTAAVKVVARESLLKDDVAVESLRGDSIYFASKVADMGTFLADHLGSAPHGVLFAVPNAYEIDSHRLYAYDEAARAGDLLLELAHMLSAKEPSPVSREVFFWRDGEYSQVSLKGTVECAGRFAETLAELRS